MFLIACHWKVPFLVSGYLFKLLTHILSIYFYSIDYTTTMDFSFGFGGKKEIPYSIKWVIPEAE